MQDNRQDRSTAKAGTFHGPWADASTRRVVRGFPGWLGLAPRRVRSSPLRADAAMMTRRPRNLGLCHRATARLLIAASSLNPRFLERFFRVQVRKCWLIHQLQETHRHQAPSASIWHTDTGLFRGSISPRCEYVQRRENAIAVGNSGTGKTPVALGLGLAACQKGISWASPQPLPWFTS